MAFDGDPLLARRVNPFIDNGGDKHTVSVASNPRWTEYDQRHIALYRQIIDLGDLANSLDLRPRPVWSEVRPAL